MGLWGPPHELPDHPAAACRAALACREKENEINEILRGKGMPTFFTRMGINTGEVLVGNIGFDERMSYTAIGDNVNLAARLEGVNKYYQTGILISESTYKAVKNLFLARFIDAVVVKGKTNGIRIYELLSELSEADQQTIARVYDFNKAMELYTQRKWQEALEIFNSLKLN
jgi:adenylate cyclase